MPHKKKLLVVCYRPLDVRMIFTTGIAKKLTLDADVMFLVPDGVVDLVKNAAPAEATVAALKVDTHKSKHFVERKIASNNLALFFGHDIGQFRTRLDTLCQRVLHFTYGGQSNETGPFMREQHLKLSDGMFDRLARLPTVSLASLASRFLSVRKFVQWLGSKLNSPKLHSEVFQDFQPDYLLVCSLGISLDGLLMREARAHAVPTVALIQSWDKTSSVGYPMVTPDKVIVWSDIMKWEAETFHDLSPDNIDVAGVPLWDVYFNSTPSASRAELRKRFGLSTKKRVVYFGMCSLGYHQGNMAMLEFLVDAIRQKSFSEEVQLVVRPHPAYFGALEEEVVSQYNDLMARVTLFQEYDDFVFLEPIIQKRETFISKQDNQLILDLLACSDVCLSVLSTQMIEACIMGLPSVTVEYGQWRTSQLDTTLQHLNLSHLNRVRRTKAVSYASNPQDLIETINAYLDDKSIKAEERDRLVRQEVPRYRGRAAERVVELLVKYLSSTDEKQQRS